MPNGGSDCCGTCPFNRTNRGYRNWLDHRDLSIPPHCEIRDVSIEDPFYTYCANHPLQRVDRDRIPIGPIMRADELDDRDVWIESPDTEEIRQHLLDIMMDSMEHGSRGFYPHGAGLDDVVMYQLYQLNEQRVVTMLLPILEEFESRDEGHCEQAETIREIVHRFRIRELDESD